MRAVRYGFIISMKDEKRVLLLKRIARVTLRVLLVCLVLFLAVTAVKAIFRKKIPTRVVDESIRFSEPDYDADIFSDPMYVSKERNIYWSEYGNTVLLGESCPESLRWHGIADASYYLAAGAEQAFFREFFICLIKGDSQNYKSFFTDSFFSNYTVPDTFTPQKIYDISVEVVNRAPGEDGSSVTSSFILRYRIMNNNGTYRGDVESDAVRPVYITTVYRSGAVRIDSIAYYEGVKRNGK